MKSRLIILVWTALVFLPLAAFAADSTTVYERRIYTAHEGKLDDLHSRFRDHTVKLFERHGMTNIGYWVPQENDANQLIYFLSYPSREARDVAWKAFLNDPDWKAAYRASIADGRLVSGVDSQFFQLTDYSPTPKVGRNTTARAFELRTYTATPNNLSNLNARFRDHTVALFKKHGMTNFAYFNLMADQKGAENTLVYLLAHESREAAKKSFDSFRQDPKWKAARKASEANAGGGLTVRGGVKSVFLNPTDYSQTR